MSGYIAETLIAVIVFGGLTAVVLRLVGWLQERREARFERQRHLLEEAWAIHVATRRIHDQASAAFLAMMDVAREKKQSCSENR